MTAQVQWSKLVQLDLHMFMELPQQFAQDTPSGGLPSFPASPITADLGGTTSELLLLGPDNSGSPLGVPSTQLNGLAAASSSITAASSLFAQGSEDTTTGDFSSMD